MYSSFAFLEIDSFHVRRIAHPTWLAHRTHRCWNLFQFLPPPPPPPPGPAPLPSLPLMQFFPTSVGYSMSWLYSRFEWSFRQPSVNSEHRMHVAARKDVPWNCFTVSFPDRLGIRMIGSRKFRFFTGKHVYNLLSSAGTGSSAGEVQ